MTESDETVDNEVTDEDNETEDQVPSKNKQKRVSELKAELAELEADGPIEDTEDPDVEKVAEDVEKEAEDIANSDADTPDEIEDESEAAAEAIAQSAKRQGVTFTDQEIDGIARRIAKRTKEIEAEDGEKVTDEKATKPNRETRTRDRRPRGTHFSERQLFGKRSS